MIRSMLSMLFAAAIVLAPAIATAVAPAVPAEAGEGSHAGAHGGEHASAGHVNFADVGAWWRGESDPPLLFALINFALLLLVLRKLALPSARSFWAKKSDAIREGLEEGARLRREAEAKLEEYKKRIADVDREVEALIADIRAEAAEEKERILAEAAAQAAATKKAADERIAAELEQARRDIERDVVAKAVEAAEKILRQRVEGSDQQSLVRGFVASLDSAGNSGDRGRPS